MIRKARIFTLILALALTAPLVAQANGLPVFTELAAKAGKAVVFISTEKTTQGNPGPQFRQQIPEGHPFREFFEQFDQFFGQQQGQPRKQLGQGSGFVISSDGLIVTNNHVINGADKVSVRFQDDKREYVAEVVGADRETDLAVIKIKADHSLATLTLGDSDAIQVGEWVLAIGNPFGLDNTVTAGIISAKHRIIGAGPFDNFLQTDASINPGNSGGPLLNMRGEVIGINTAINAAAENIGFAIPSTQASKIISQLKAGKSVQRGWLGVTIQQVTETQAKALGLAEPAGALVASVGKDAPADKGGVKQGDVILEVNGQKVEDNNDLLKKIAGLAPGDKVRLGLWSNGKVVTKTVTLGQRTEKAMAVMAPNSEDKGQAATVLGMALKPINDREAKALGLDKTQGLLVVNVDPNTAAGEEGIRQGDVVLQANQKDVNSVSDLESVIKRDKERGAVMLLIKRQGQSSFVALPLD
ncbi:MULTISPECIES: Do family serine endopeptidase [unclassified Pseudodesulfovibrio]|uniref:Do family serine endopeptidase n=1 Tax=unclassified Pseudodesulfovibrio TaxID=2661612 RepID=UPI000FEB8EAA|nr:MULTISPECIES: Do family serine endopeptidase [unclassified Pseudodesulfovibrio]MCJ2164609.1 Do family serine endopeptidase [Pseudodesulfovibrio sp. S3-i]RWU04197.1 Do family serine endopeptidase [Pseudodesulfovibrio sp. S3]